MVGMFLKLIAALFAVQTISHTAIADIPDPDEGNKWTFCYNDGSKDIDHEGLYFINSDPEINTEIDNEKEKCHGIAAKIQPSGYHGLVNVEVGTDGFPTGKPGVPLIVSFKSRKSVLITKWSSGANSTEVMVLEPDLTNNTVKTLCSFQDDQDTIQFNADYEKGTLKFGSIVDRSPKEVKCF